MRIRSGSAALQRDTQRIARSEELCSLNCTCAYFASDARVEKNWGPLAFANRVAYAIGLRCGTQAHRWAVFRESGDVRRCVLAER